MTAPAATQAHGMETLQSERTSPSTPLHQTGDEDAV
jgi:hypothetical protein